MTQITALCTTMHSNKVYWTNIQEDRKAMASLLNGLFKTGKLSNLQSLITTCTRDSMLECFGLYNGQASLTEQKGIIHSSSDVESI